MNGLANVENDGHIITVRMAETSIPSCTHLKDMAIDECDGGFRADMLFKACSSCIVETNHCVMGIDKAREALIQQYSTIAHNCTSPVGILELRIPELASVAVMFVDPIFDEVDEGIHDAGLVMFGIDPFSEGGLELGPEKGVTTSRDLHGEEDTRTSESQSSSF